MIRISESIPEIHPYVTARGGVVILNGPFPMAQALQVTRLCDAAPKLLKFIENLRNLSDDHQDDEVLAEVCGDYCRNLLAQVEGETPCEPNPNNRGQ